MSRRRYDWQAVAAMARQSGGTWRLHPHLAAITTDTLHHMRRRVPPLKPDAGGRFEFARGAQATDDVGRSIFDCYVRYVAHDHED